MVKPKKIKKKKTKANHIVVLYNPLNQSVIEKIRLSKLGFLSDITLSFFFAYKSCHVISMIASIIVYIFLICKKWIFTFGVVIIKHMHHLKMSLRMFSSYLVPIS